MQNYQNTVENSATGSPVSNVTITVKVYPPPGANATIYSVNDVGATPIAGSSVVTDQYGQFGFYAANGTYYFVLTEANGTITTTGPIVIQDPGLPQKAIPIDADKFVYADSTTAFSGVFATWANLKSMWDGLYVRLANLAASGGSALVGHLPGGTGAVATTVQSKLRESISILDFLPKGYVIDGSVDYSTQIQAALTYGAMVGRVVTGCGIVYKCTAGLSIDISKTNLTDCYLDFSSIAFNSGIAAITLTSTITDPNTGLLQHSIHPLQGVMLAGPTGTGGNTVAILLAPVTITGTPWIHAGILEYGGITGFNRGVVTASGGWGWTLRNFCLTSAGGRSLTSPIIFGSGTNTGEKHTVTDCIITNFDGSGIYCNSGDVRINNTSLDGSGTFIEVASGYCFANGHFESSADVGKNMFKVDAANGFLDLHDSMIIMGQTTVTKELGYSAQLSSNSPWTCQGISFKNCFTAIPSNYLPDYLVGGDGPASASGMGFLTNRPMPPLCKANNLLADRNFAAGTTDWTVTGTGSLIRLIGQNDGPTPYGGVAVSTYGRLDNQNGAVTITSAFMPIQPGQQMSILYYYRPSGMVATSSSWSALIQIYDATKTVVVQTINAGSGSTDSTSWLRANNNSQNVVVLSGGCYAVATITLSAKGGGTHATFDFGLIDFQVYR